jgi:hypothetical protein
VILSEAYSITERRIFARRKILERTQLAASSFSANEQGSCDAFDKVPARQKNSHKMLKSDFFAHAGTLLIFDPSALSGVSVALC